MMKKTLFFVLQIFVFISLYGQENPEYPEINYFNCPLPPADSAVIFAEGFVSLNNRWEEKIGFSYDGKAAFFGIHDDKNYFNPRVMHTKYVNGQWTKPDTATFAKNRKAGWPLMSLYGKVLFMEEVVGKTKNGVIGQVVYAKKENGSWSAIKSINPDVKAKEGFGLGQITDDSVFYFHDRYDRVIYSSKIINGKYSKPKPLSYRINPAVEFYVSAKNDYIIFRPLNWNNEFHISFRDKDFNWAMPIPFSHYFRAGKWDSKGAGPYVSPDNKYFFFMKKGDVYWVKTDFIEVLRKRSR